MTADEFLDHAYRLILRRPPDEGSRTAWQGGESTSRASLIRGLVDSDEFLRLKVFDDGVTPRPRPVARAVRSAT